MKVKLKMENAKWVYDVHPDDFTSAGEASSDVKKKLKEMGFSAEIIRKVAIAMYEGEINMVIHAHGGIITVEVTPTEIKMELTDKGPGIANVAEVFKEGFSTATEDIRSLGFGAGMGLPNMKKYSDTINVQSEVGVGTTVTMTVNI
jgi:anti-sigma regulatory factor (Ser/Thr protein kinase)